MKIKITDIAETAIEGVTVYHNTETPYAEDYFEWAHSPLTAPFSASDISGGILTCWHHTFTFHELEYHEDQEMFYFMQGTAVMVFADQEQGTVVPDSIQMVKIPAGTQLIIQKGKAHFVPAALDSTPVKIVVVSPNMEAPRLSLKEPVTGVL